MAKAKRKSEARLNARIASYNEAMRTQNSKLKLHKPGSQTK